LDFIVNLIEVVDILNIGKEIIMASLESQLPDLEDAIQSIASSMNNLDDIVTRNQKDFIKSDIKALTPTDFLVLMQK